MAQSSGVGELVKWGAIAGLAWWGYNKFFSVTPVGATPTTTTGGTAAPPPSASSGGGGSLDATYQQMVKDATAGEGAAGVTAGLNVDQWGFYLGKQFPAPAPEEYEPAGFDRAAKISSAQYWSLISAWLKKNRGMTGLGHFAGLSAAYGRM